MLKQNGYNTMALGKWHLAPYTAYTAAGPFDRWPLGMGFEKYYGFLGGETDQWAPLLVQDNHFIDTPTRPGYHLTEDLADHAIADIRDQQQANTGRPFFSYLALGAAHAPLHAPKEFIAKYKGKFDQGWDGFARRPSSGRSSSASSRKTPCLPPANPGVQPWADLNANQKKVYCTLQEVFAGYVEHADHQLGKVFAALDDMGVRDNTLVILRVRQRRIAGRIAERHPEHRSLSQLLPGHGRGDAQEARRRGRPSTDPHYPMGWAMAGNSPLKRWKQDTHSGGNTDPFIVSWPAKIKDGGAIRNQYHHIVDVVPTILEVTGLPAPTSVNGVKQMPLHGVSMAYTFTDANAQDPQDVAVLRDARQPGDLVGRLDGGDLAQEGRRPGKTTSGNSTIPTRTSPSPTTLPPRTRRSSRS